MSDDQDDHDVTGAPDRRAGAQAHGDGPLRLETQAITVGAPGAARLALMDAGLAARLRAALASLPSRGITCQTVDAAGMRWRDDPEVAGPIHFRIDFPLPAEHAHSRAHAPSSVESPRVVPAGSVPARNAPARNNPGAYRSASSEDTPLAAVDVGLVMCQVQLDAAAAETLVGALIAYCRHTAGVTADPSGPEEP